MLSESWPRECPDVRWSSLVVSPADLGVTSLSCFSIIFFSFSYSEENVSSFLFFFQIFSLLALVPEFSCRCFLRIRRSMEMWCLDDTGRDSWDWVGPPTPQSGVEAPRLLKRSLSRLGYEERHVYGHKSSKISSASPTNNCWPSRAPKKSNPASNLRLRQLCRHQMAANEELSDAKGSW